jgi:hypothetical protein
MFSAEAASFIDPTGWAEIEGEAFAPGFFLWNSEVGRRSVGVQTFWFQAVCQNYIVWDAVEVVDFSRKHTANVSDSIENRETGGPARPGLRAGGHLERSSTPGKTSGDDHAAGEVISTENPSHLAGDHSEAESA